MTHAATTGARRAQFDPSTQRRRTMIAKINIARQQLDMVEDDYRQLLLDTTGSVSLKACNDGQLVQMLDVLKGKGFQPLPKGEPRGAKGVAMHPLARKARALWISLHQLGVVRNPAEEALEAFAKRQLGCDRLVWARQSDAYKLVEALKDMGRRAGWRMDEIGTRKPLGVIALQANLCHAIVGKLKAAGIVPDDWGLHDAAWKLCGVENGKDTAWSAEDYQRLAAGLGAKLRAAVQEGGAA